MRNFTLTQNSNGRAFGLTVGVALALATVAQAKCPTGLPPGVYCGAPDVKAATSGTYALDPNHTAVIAKVSHIGYSLSVFRFNKVSGTLVWDPTEPAASKLSATVDTASIATPVPGFAAELSGDRFLKTTAFPQATFVSTAFHRIDATHGKVDGQFTLMGVTKPMTFDVVLIGAGKGFGAPRIGVEATSHLDPAAFGLPGMFADPIALVLDAEFQRTP